MEIIRAGHDPNAEGVRKFTVTQGAFNSIYSKQGFVPVSAAIAAQKPTGYVAENGEFIPPIDGPVLTGDDGGEAKGPESQMTEEQQFVKDFVEIPFGQWSKEDVKRVCEIEKIDTSSVSSFTDAKNVVKAALVEKGIMKSA